MQLDIGFGDVVIPAPEHLVYPTLLEFAAPTLRGYSRESAIAEKFEAMIKLGELNSRMKDFFDIWLLSRQFDFDGSILAEAVATTFATRGTTLPLDPTAFSPAFAQDNAKATQWRAFLRRNRLHDTTQQFEEIVASISTFLKPVAASIIDAQPFQMSWRAPGPWEP